MRETITANKSRAGFTILELVVAIGVFSILVSIAVGGFVRALRTQRQVASLIAAQSNVSLAIEQMAREIRTGADFCIDPRDPANPAASPCVFLSDSLVEELIFTNASGKRVTYDVQGGVMLRDADGGGFEPMTAENVSVEYLRFRLLGEGRGDQYPPRVTISLGVAPRSPDLALRGIVTNLVTTISARSFDQNE